MRSVVTIVGLSLVLSGCGGASVSAPAQFTGTWGADCSAPFVAFARGTIHVYPDDATYPLKAATLTGSDLTVGYDSKAGAVTETYAAEGETLRLRRGTYAGQEATWDKAPMRKCN
jgi:hypothetical protein